MKNTAKEPQSYTEKKSVSIEEFNKLKQEVADLSQNMDSLGNGLNKAIQSLEDKGEGLSNEIANVLKELRNHINYHPNVKDKGRRNWGG